MVAARSGTTARPPGPLIRAWATRPSLVSVQMPAQYHSEYEGSAVSDSPPGTSTRSVPPRWLLAAAPLVTATPPSVRASDRGLPRIAVLPVTMAVAASRRSTWSEPDTATHTCSPSTAIPVGACPTACAAVTVEVAVSMRNTVSLPVLATHTELPSGEAAMAVGSLPTAIVRTTVPLVGSTLDHVAIAAVDDPDPARGHRHSQGGPAERERSHRTVVRVRFASGHGRAGRRPRPSANRSRHPPVQCPPRCWRRSGRSWGRCGRSTGRHCRPPSRAETRGDARWTAAHVEALDDVPSAGIDAQHGAVRGASDPQRPGAEGDVTGSSVERRRRVHLALCVQSHDPVGIRATGEGHAARAGIGTGARPIRRQQACERDHEHDRSRHGR